MAQKDNTTPANEEPVIDKAAHARNVQDAQAALAREFQTLIQDAERLLKSTQDAAGAHTDEIRAKISENIARAKTLLADKQGSLCEQTRAKAEAAEEYIQGNPWQAVGIAAGVGFLLGLILRR